MRLLASLLWACLALKSHALPTEALVYLSEGSHLPSEWSLPSISPVTARLLLAQRLGLSQYHSLGDADEGTLLNILNTFGLHQTGVFEEKDDASGTEKVLVIIEGLSNPEDVIGSSTRPALSIANPPSAVHNEELLVHLLDQDHLRRSDISHYSFLPLDSSNTRGGLSISSSRLFSQPRVFDARKPHLYDYIKFYNYAGLAGHDHTAILHITTLQGLKPSDGDSYNAALSDVRGFWDFLHEPNSQISSTIILMPASSKAVKRSATSPYGAFNHPLSTRQQRPQPEEPLTTPSTPSTNQPYAPETLQAPTSPLPHGILPVCHDSLDSAISATNNCSGHGTPYKKNSGESEPKDCFACRCVPTVLELEGGGKKTVYWGGPACQKKDISVPFFLLAGLSIALVGAATWGVGLLASIGQEDLPSVIGAGVTGPRAQK